MLPLNQFITLTPEISSLLVKLEAHKIAFDIIPKDTGVITNLRRRSLLNSALFSARIEGNSLTLDTLTDSRDKLEKLEVQNLLDTYTWIAEASSTKLNLDFIRELHRRSMKNLRVDAGHFRAEQNAIFNAAGVAVYLPPPAGDVQSLLEAMLSRLTQKDTHPVIANIIAHYQFEKIHPFVDGNGRVGRLVFATQLRQSGYHFGDLLGPEKHIADTRSDYYYYLGSEDRDVAPFTTYFLRLLSRATESVIAQLSAVSPNPPSSLLPRRQELVNIIRDHSPCSLDFLHRRSVAVPASTLRYDLLQLQKAGFIRKLGMTRGALYSSTSFPE